MSQTFAHDSLLGGLNIVKKRDGRNLLHPGERPPYPIINDNPTVYEVFSNLNKADFGLLLMFTAIGTWYKLNNVKGSLLQDLLLDLQLPANSREDQFSI